LEVKNVVRIFNTQGHIVQMDRDGDKSG